MSSNADLSLLSPDSGNNYQRTTETVSGRSNNTRARTGKAGLTVGIIALLLGIIAIVMIIIFIIVWAVNRSSDTSNPHWHIIMGQANGNNSNAESFKPDGNDVLIVNARATHITISIQRPGQNLTGRIFMIDNTGNSQGVSVQSLEATLTDSINDGTIQGRHTATYMWTTANSIRRLY